jgi:nitrile hydratase accessory protein
VTGVSVELATTGPAAPPRSNGELVFEAPWESRAFGVAVALNETGALDYERFRATLIEEIAASDGAYYERWAAALERVLVAGGVVSEDELDARAAALEHEWSHDHHHH